MKMKKEFFTDNEKSNENKPLNENIPEENITEENIPDEDISDTEAPEAGGEAQKEEMPAEKAASKENVKEKKTVKKSIIDKRSLRFGSYSVALTVIVIAAAVILNAIVGATQIREKLKIDLTSNRLYSIGEETDEVLKGLNRKVEIIGLFDESQMGSTQYSQVIEFIKQYESKSNMIDIRYVDPEKNPAFIQNELDPNNVLGVKKNDFVVKSDKRTKVLSTSDIFEYTYDESSYSYYTSGLNAEYAFTGAIRFVTSDNIPVVYYTEGHGEGDLEQDYTELKSSLELNGYELKKINLASVDKIPEDASIVLFASPQQDLNPVEKEVLTVYMENGGNTIFLFDPIQSNNKFSNFEDFLTEFNISLGYDVVFEMASDRAAYGQPYYFMPVVEDNSINSNLDPDKFSMSIINARSIHIMQNVKDWIETTPLLTTSSKAIGRSLMEGIDDNAGPLNIAVAVENNGGMKPSKTIVVGNSYFVTDEGMDVGGSGGRFLLNGINWLEDKEADIYIPVKKYTTPKLTGVTQQTLTFLFIGLIIVVPLIIIGVGVFVWLRRRHL